MKFRGYSLLIKHSINLLTCLRYFFEELVLMYLIASPLIIPLKTDAGWYDEKCKYWYKLSVFWNVEMLSLPVCSKFPSLYIVISKKSMEVLELVEVKFMSPWKLLSWKRKLLRFCCLGHSTIISSMYLFKKMGFSEIVLKKFFSKICWLLWVKMRHP